ncbi:hypothetical protein [Novosphingobium sp. TH158]|uniref:hypothetical protein n=1 Tax=Novosphingobium sp. TH158 TaxID=2067455 RepID=UPI000C7DEBE8|nr:hypothetical protein [Novosphingobium sp. TH158]PLK26616.1 hypothetical protein C0V78_06745 [Novosphingobium sp. TH158]
MLGLGKRSYWQHINPRGALADFREVFRQAGKNRWRIAAASLAITSVLFWALTKDSWRIPPARPQITYINSWPLDRTEAETQAFIRKNQAMKDEQEAIRKRNEEETKALYRQLGRISGMDVEKIEREAREQEAAEQARKQQAPVGQR